MKTIVFFFFCFLLLAPVNIQSQVEGASRTNSQFILKGVVIESETNDPMKRVNVEISGGAYTTTNNAGEFSIRAHVGNELIIRSDEFETVYYTVKDRQRVNIRVENSKEDILPVSKIKSSRGQRDHFREYIDSAKTFLKKDARKSIEFVTLALESTNKKPTLIQNSIAFETLGDINLYWKQNDLAVNNYKQSISGSPRTDVQIKLAKAYRLNQNYQESIVTYKALLKNSLSIYQQIEVYEGLGDTYNAINDPLNSIFNYQKGLDLANERNVTPKITDLNSKIGEAYAQGGELEEAESYFDNSLDLAEKENKKRAITEKNKVADFYGKNRDFDKEIQMREETIDEINSMDEDFIDLEDEDQNSALTPQSQNYKIANAFVAQEKYEEAIPYLEKSIEEADDKEDLIVQKDATRKLSEIYKDIGEYDKAAESYQNYVELVDELYIKKEQEISQAARFSKEIALQQNRITSLENERKLNESRYELAFENKELTQKNIRVQRWVIISLILIAILLLVTAYILNRSVKQQKYANNLLALKSLRTQMNPHFIFNALNSVNSFIAKNDERAANKYLSDFSLLMRSVLENSEEDFIPLEKEIELLDLYVKLEHFRFKDKFDYKINIDEHIDVGDFVIPPMLLQPYVENAVWHGLRYKEEKGLLEINFEPLDSDKLLISISDDGIGRKKSKSLKTEHQKKQNSKGMGNIKERISILNTMYKDKVDVVINDLFENEEGTRVQLILKKD